MTLVHILVKGLCLVGSRGASAPKKVSIIHVI